MSDIAASVPMICEMMSEGKSLRAACRELGLGESSVRYWLNKDEEAFAHSVRARELGCDALADECIDIADDPTIVDVQEKRIKIDTRIRLIGKWSKRYSDKLMVENKTEVTHKHDFDSLSTEELETLEKIIAKSQRDTSNLGAPEPVALH